MRCSGVIVHQPSALPCTAALGIFILTLLSVMGSCIMQAALCGMLHVHRAGFPFHVYCLRRSMEANAIASLLDLPCPTCRSTSRQLSLPKSGSFVYPSSSQNSVRVVPAPKHSPPKPATLQKRIQSADVGGTPPEQTPQDTQSHPGHEILSHLQNSTS